MNKEIMTKVKDAGGVYVLDYSMPEDAAYVLESFGGEDNLRQNFPMVYEAYLKTVEAHKARRVQNAPQGDKKVAFRLNSFAKAKDGNMATAQAVSSALFADPSYTAEDATKRKPARSWVAANLAARIYNKNEPAEVYYSNVFKYQQPENIVLNYETVAMPEETIDLCETTAEIHALDPDNYVYSCIVKGTITEGISLINKFTVNDPVGKGNPILMLYGRTRSSSPSYVDADYYSDSNGEYYNNGPVDNKIKTLMPVSGSIEFKPGVTFTADILRKPDQASPDYKHLIRSIIKTGNVKVADMYKDLNDGDAFDALKKCFKVVQHGAYPVVEFDIKREGSVDWHDDVSGISAYKNNSVEYSLNAGFTLDARDSDGLPFYPQVSIASLPSSKLPPGTQYYTSNNLLVYVPPISVHWGCYARDTLISLVDGSNKRIDMLKAGDKVLALGGGSVTCADLVSGEENEIFVINTDKGSIRLTGGHPLMLEDGNTIIAAELKPGDAVKTAGSSGIVSDVFIEVYDDMVFNPVFEESGPDGLFIIANGFYCGDFNAQNKNFNNITPLTEEEKELARQFNALF